MSKSSNSSNCLSSMMGFTFPVLHTKSDKWYIDFKAIDPDTGIMKRKKYFVKKCSRKADRKNHAEEMMSFLNLKLHEGWTPWGYNDYSKYMETFADCLGAYENHFMLSDRKKTRINYSSKLRILKEYNSTLDRPVVMAYQFDSSFCCDFLEWLCIERHVKAVTRNNYQGWLYGLAEFMVLRHNIPTNPLVGMSRLKESDKYRKDLSLVKLKELEKYLTVHDRFFYLACLMEYYTLLRPNELSLLKIGDINVKSSTIFVSKDISKHRKNDTVAINKKLLEVMLDLGVLSGATTDYLFSCNFKPGPKHVSADQFNRRWKEVREALGWSDCYQFYSLKDTGIRDLANAEGIVVARTQARHVDVASTNRYILHQPVSECAKHFKGGL